MKTLTTSEPNFPRNLARDFLQYSCELAEMAVQQWKAKQAQKQ